MQRNLLTEAELRAAMLPADTTEYVVSESVCVTPSAKDFLKERGIALVKRKAPDPESTMPVEEIRKTGTQTYIDACTGKGYAEKPEEMTHLRKNLLISKADPRISFRGKLDSLQADVLSLQLAAAEEGLQDVCGNLQEMLEQLRSLLAAEVRETPFEMPLLLGMDEKQLRYVSHNVREEIGMDHPVPSYRMGRMALGLNSLRTKIRETELAAVRLKEPARPDIVKALNRMSSAAYILFCRVVKQGEATPAAGAEDKGIRVEISARHVHLTKEAVERLFGKGARLEKVRDLSQPGEFLSRQRLTLSGPKGELSNVAILGPERKSTQVELSFTDAKALGVKAPVNLSGNLENAGDVTLAAGENSLAAPGSVIIARAHAHMTPADAKKYSVKDGQIVHVRINGERPVTLDKVIARVSENFSTAIHIDFDEANACGIKADATGTIIL